MNDCRDDGAIDGKLPTIDDTIAVVTLLGRILDELRSRLAAAELAVKTLEKEKLALRAEVRALAEGATRGPVALPRQVQPPEPHLDDALLALIKNADMSFGRIAAHH